MNRQIKERLEAALDKYGARWNRAAKDIGYSSPVLSGCRNNKYSGDMEKLEEAIVKWIGRTEQACARKKAPVAETGRLRRITNAIAMARAEGDIALIADDAGGGKTTAARYYAEQNLRATIRGEGDERPDPDPGDTWGWTRRG
jgi:DNA transposition AAA+ family ATPase